MSRSYKKPIVKDNSRSKKKEKRRANKKVRRYQYNLVKGRSYKKVFCSYDITDYRGVMYASKKDENDEPCKYRLRRTNMYFSNAYEEEKYWENKYRRK